MSAKNYAIKITQIVDEAPKVWRGCNLIRTREVLGSNLDWDIDYPDSGFPSVPQENGRTIFGLGHDRFQLIHLFDLI
jgi:hypothetical protein